MSVAADGEGVRWFDVNFDHCRFFHENALDVP